MKYKPKIGADFPISKDVVVARTNQIAEVTRSTIALSFVFLGALALMVAAAYSVYRGEFVVLQTVWAVLAAPLGLIIGYYFRGSGPNVQGNNESAA